MKIGKKVVLSKIWQSKNKSWMTQLRQIKFDLSIHIQYNPNMKMVLFIYSHETIPSGQS